MRQADWAQEIARKHLEIPLPRRWAHIQGVARQARSLASILGEDADLLEAAAWLHDVGYSPELIDTGFHPLDGARYLRDVQHANGTLCRLVANHSEALIEAEERGLAGALSAEFPPASPLISDALTYCDMTTGPDGQPISADERLADIRARYGPGHVVGRSIERSAGELLDAVSVIRAYAEAELVCMTSVTPPFIMNTERHSRWMRDIDDPDPTGYEFRIDPVLFTEVFPARVNPADGA
jgi:hypothetical protein